MVLCACCCRSMPACALKLHVMWECEAVWASLKKLCALLKKLEAEFPEQQLLPEDAALRHEAEKLMSQAEEFSTAGFK